MIRALTFLIALLLSASGYTAENQQRNRVPTTELSVTGLDSALPADREIVFTSEWAAAKRLHFDYTINHSIGPEQQAFWAALKFVVGNKPVHAIDTLERLLDRSVGAELRSHAIEVLAMLYQNQERTEALLQLVADNPDLLEREIVDPGDLALMRALLNADTPQMKIGAITTAIQVPLTFSFAGTPVVRVRLNETHEEAFWIDTGSSGTLIATDVAEAASLRFLTPPVAVRNVDVILPIRGAVVDHLNIGALEMTGVPVGVIDGKILTIAGRRIAGIIGWPILRELRLEFDGPNGTLTFSPTSKPLERSRNFFWFDYPFVRLLTDDGVPLNFGVDTGADVTRLRPELLERLPNLQSMEIRSRSAAFGGLSSSQDRMVEQIDFLVPDARLSFRFIKTADVAHARFVVPDGRLGADVLRKARVTMDHRAGVFRVDP